MAMLITQIAVCEVLAPQMGLKAMSDLILAAWNSRGCNSSSRARHITEFLRKFKVSIIGVLETKIESDAEPSFHSRFCPSWPYVSNCSATERGRIWLTWDTSVVDIRILHVYRQFIHVIVHCRDSRPEFLATFVYGSNSRTTREMLWADLSLLPNLRTCAWILLPLRSPSVAKP